MSNTWQAQPDVTLSKHTRPISTKAMTDNCNPRYFCQLMLCQCHRPHLEVGIRVIECLRMNSDVRIYRGSPYRHRKESFESIPKLSDPTTTLQSLPKANRDGWKTDSRPYSMHPPRPQTETHPTIRLLHSGWQTPSTCESADTFIHSWIHLSASTMYAFRPHRSSAYVCSRTLDRRWWFRD